MDASSRPDMTGSQRKREWLTSLAAAPTSPSAYGFLLALLATVAAKVYATHSLSQVEHVFRESFGACAADLLVYSALALFVVSAERIRPLYRWVTYPVAFLAVLVALTNAAYMMIANDQINARAVEVGLNRIDEVADIALMETLARAGRLGLYAFLAAPLGYLAIHLAWKRSQRSADALALLRIKGWAALTIASAVILVCVRVSGLPRTLAADLLSDNALVHTYVTWLDVAMGPPDEYRGALELHFRPAMVSSDAMAPIAASPTAPNVLVLLLESTRFDHVELPLPGHKSYARTPNLLELARRGTYFTNVHAAMPHTSKSLVSIFCGRLPSMENMLLELADGVLQQCLPELFRDAGYSTMFAQSALGSFEGRPRMTVRLGYRRFAAYENFVTEPLGYLSGDDRALPGVFAGWLSKLADDQRFFATILTSGTHHPYQLPSGVQAADPARGRSRYAALVEIEDGVLGELVEILRRHGRLDNTVILAVADHGEGLPGDAVRQHDNNFFDESLHVPMILAGPGLPVGRNDALLSLLDVAPTVLGALGVANVLPDDELRFGTNAFAPSPRRYAPFACWNDQMCEGFVASEAKVLRLPSDHREIAFDRTPLRTGEDTFRAPTEAERTVLDLVKKQSAITRLSRAPELDAVGMRLPSGFVCQPNTSLCDHPSRPKGGFHDLGRR